MRDKLWNLLDKMRFEYHYYQEYRQSLERVRIGIRIFASIAALLLVGGLSAIINIPAIGQLFALAAGILALIYEQTMIDKKLNVFRYFIPDINSQLNLLQEDWLKVNDVYEYSEEDIAKIFTAHFNAFNKISERYVDEIAIPDRGKLRNKASKTTEMFAQRLS
ncbi:MAG: hypothetical protein LBE35_08785 [Clostridiales bacterium]|jgi:hypothetical protein|nr:hypothetical protein [Clostridiales bacterium]